MILQFTSENENALGNREQVFGNFTFCYIFRFFSVHLLSHHLKSVEIPSLPEFDHHSNQHIDQGLQELLNRLIIRMQRDELIRQ
ncbi:MAG: hypothetical protein ACKPKP_07260, partial [Dolichospermum sp.]